MASAGPRGRKEERAAWDPEHLVVALQSYRKLGGQPLPTVPSRPLFASRCAGTVVRAAMLHARQSGSRVGEVLEVRIYIYIADTRNCKRVHLLCKFLSPMYIVTVSYI